MKLPGGIQVIQIDYHGILTTYRTVEVIPGYSRKFDFYFIQYPALNKLIDEQDYSKTPNDVDMSGKWMVESFTANKEINKEVKKWGRENRAHIDPPDFVYHDFYLTIEGSLENRGKFGRFSYNDDCNTWSYGYYAVVDSNTISIKKNAMMATLVGCSPDKLILLFQKIMASIKNEMTYRLNENWLLLEFNHNTILLKKVSNSQ